MKGSSFFPEYADSFALMGIWDVSFACFSCLKTEHDDVGRTTFMTRILITLADDRTGIGLSNS